MSNKFVNKMQVGGRHYVDMAMQPWELIEQTCTDFWYGNVVKYVSRWEHKGGVEDLRKAEHVISHMKITQHQLLINPAGMDSLRRFQEVNHLEDWQRNVIYCVLTMNYGAALDFLDQGISSMETNQEGDSL